MKPRRSGFTLIELLLVMLVIGILAVIAIPFYWKSRERAYYTAMTSDLKNLASMQELYYSGPMMYAGTAGQDAAAAPGLNYNSSAGVTVTIREAAASGWSAEATHAALDPVRQKCTYYYGGAAPLPPAISPGLVTCTGE